jgi:hypothetical protein
MNPKLVKERLSEFLHQHKPAKKSDGQALKEVRAA